MLGFCVEKEDMYEKNEKKSKKFKNEQKVYWLEEDYMEMKMIVVRNQSRIISTWPLKLAHCAPLHEIWTPEEHLTHRWILKFQMFVKRKSNELQENHTLLKPLLHHLRKKSKIFPLNKKVLETICSPPFFWTMPKI